VADLAGLGARVTFGTSLRSVFGAAAFEVSRGDAQPAKINPLNNAMEIARMTDS
jgi:hypothetical protein